MQTAVDSAALEGLRWRDVYRRRTKPTASRQARSSASLFTDYVDSSGGTVQYGAGPVVNFSGGVGPADLAAAQIDEPVRSRRFTSRAGLELNLSRSQPKAT